MKGGKGEGAMEYDGEREREQETKINYLFMRVTAKHVCFFTSSPRPNKGLL